MWITAHVTVHPRQQGLLNILSVKRETSQLTLVNGYYMPLRITGQGLLEHASLCLTLVFSLAKHFLCVSFHLFHSQIFAEGLTGKPSLLSPVTEARSTQDT